MKSHKILLSTLIAAAAASAVPAFAAEDFVDEWYSNVTYIGHSSYKGGAIYTSNNVNISGGTNTFEKNTASEAGGAIYTDADKVVFSGNGTKATFSGNTANGSPNDICAPYAYVTISDAGTYSFDGGIVAEHSIRGVLSVESGANVTFTGNAINSITKTTISGTGTNVSFGENTTTTTSGLSVTGGATIEVGGSVTVNGDFTVDAASTLKYTGTNRISVSGTTTISGTLAFAEGVAMDSVSLTQGASVSVSDGAVKLTAAAAITVNSVSKVATENLSLGDNVETLAAWDFDISKSETDAVTVSMDIGDLASSVDDIRVFHQNSDNTWTDVTGSVADLALANGVVSFSTTNFSAYAVGTATAIPEPSAFGLLAGLGALALAISRRRRSRKN